VLAALAELIRHVAPVFLMCDGRDLGVVTEAKSTFNALPTIYVYDRIPAGIGLSDRLYELQGQVLEAAAELVRECPCENGCPSCIGPITAIDEDIKARTQRLLQAIRAGSLG
jgi:DEAD/DEAH box helicase domain-containing protein